MAKGKESVRGLYWVEKAGHLWVVYNRQGVTVSRHGTKAQALRAAKVLVGRKVKANPRQRKTRDVWKLWANYGQGWEHELTEDTWKEMRQRLKEYRENAPQYSYKATHARERIGAEIANPTAGVEAIPSREEVRRASRIADRAETLAALTAWHQALARGVTKKTARARSAAAGREARKIAYAEARRGKANPTAGVEAIPTRWTPATVTTRGGQVQIRTGGRR